MLIRGLSLRGRWLGPLCIYATIDVSSGIVRSKGGIVSLVPSCSQWWAGRPLRRVRRITGRRRDCH